MAPNEKFNKQIAELLRDPREDNKNAIKSSIESADPSSQFDMLLALAYAGSVETQRLFAEVMVSVCNDSNKRRILITDKKRKDILSRLLWCSTWDDNQTKKNRL